MNNLSVVIITRNRIDKLKRCLESIRTNLSGSEVIVVDNGSIDGTVELLKNLRTVIPIFLEANRGVAEARNIGIKKTSRRFIMFLDDDAWIEDLDFEKIKEYLSKNSKVGIIAPRIFYPKGNIQESIRSFPKLRAIFWRGTRLYRIFPNVKWYREYILDNILKGNTIQKIDWAIGACQIIRREMFDIAGLLDKHYFFYYEDADFCRKVMIQGYSTVYWPYARVYHEYTRLSSKGTSLYLFRHIVNIIRFLMNK